MQLKIEHRTISVIVAVFLAAAIAVCEIYWKGEISYDQAAVSLQTLYIVVTLSVLFSAYLALEASRQKALSTSELTSRPALHWNVVSKGRKPVLEVESRNNQAFDFEAKLECNGMEKTVVERHLEESNDANPRVYAIPLGGFLPKALGQKSSATLHVDVTYYSELGGRYNYAYSKVFSRDKSGFRFQQRKLARVMLPWFSKPKEFRQEEA